MENIDINIDKDNLENIDMAILEYIDIYNGIDKGILQTISISIKYRIDKDLANRTPLGKPLVRILHVQTAFCQIAFRPTPPPANGRFVAGIFRRKSAKSLKQRF